MAYYYKIPHITLMKLTGNFISFLSQNGQQKVPAGEKKKTIRDF